MTPNRIQPRIRICLLSAFLALALFSFFAFGSGSAHAMTRSASSSATTVARIAVNKQGGTVFRPAAITVKSGAAVQIINKTPFTRFIVANGQLTRLAPGASMTITLARSQVVSICGGGGTLAVTVV